MFKNLLWIVVLPVMLLSTIGNACQIKIPDQNDDRINIPLDLSSQRPVLTVKIGDKGPYNFIFDSGSGANVIDTDLAIELDLEVIGLTFHFEDGREDFEKKDK